MTMRLVIFGLMRAFAIVAMLLLLALAGIGCDAEQFAHVSQGVGAVIASVFIVLMAVLLVRSKWWRR